MRYLAMCLIATAIVAAGFPATTHRATARSSYASLPMLRLDYYAAGKDHLALRLDPALVDYPRDFATMQMVDAGLVRLRPDGRVAPDLATWTVSPSHLVYTFTLRKNARFSNGDRVTARDVVYSMTRALGASNFGAAMVYLSDIKGAAAYSQGKAKTVTGLHALTSSTVRITVTSPVADFLVKLTYPPADVVDPKVLGPVNPEINDPLLTSCSMNQGAGPFRFVCFASQLGSGFYPDGSRPSYTLVPNPYYYGRKPRLRVVLQTYDAAPTAYAAYRQGRIDTSPLPRRDATQWPVTNSQVRQYPTSTIVYLALDLRLAPFDDKQCRLAAVYALDRSALTRQLKAEYARPLYSMVPSGMLGFTHARDGPHYNPTRARQEVRQCPERSVPLQLWYYFELPDDAALFESVTAMLNQVGFQAQAIPYAENGGTGFDCIWQGMFRCGIQIAEGIVDQDYADPERYLTPLLTCTGTLNGSGWCNHTYDRLAGRARVDWNRKTRGELYVRAQELALGDVVDIPLVNVYTRELVKPYVHGLVGTETSPYLQPEGGDWANVSISRKTYFSSSRSG